MEGMKYGCARVSTGDRTPALLLAALKKAGCKNHTARMAPFLVRAPERPFMLYYLPTPTERCDSLC